MRSLLLLCALATALILTCKTTKRHELSVEPALVTAGPAQAETTLAPALIAPAPRPSLLSLLTLGTAVLAAVSAEAADSPLDANAQLAVRIVDTTAQLEASAARVADARAR
jgi:hypothetical protein